MRQTPTKTDPGPLLLTVPGIDNSGPEHWQTLWEHDLESCHRAELGMWHRPHRNSWVTKLNAAIVAARRPVVLIAHSLGCHAVAWWNTLEKKPTGRVIGALLVAPPNLEGTPFDSRLCAFAPLVRDRLRFPSVLVASEDDPYASFGHSRKMARLWGSRFVNAGWLGHINADSRIGDWPFGRFLLQQFLLDLEEPRMRPLRSMRPKPENELRAN
ncbi:alpha/beta hydrolase [Allopontixanthobacter sp.]|uniref:RBBP9/YdeN family alpha/beta hydrolase n=1 Tax=Allopontixanthobacter sp. TaxID=2906452 RepID=UPI002ABC21FF|nr:alpha/beta hydrolase [Allopontixanthobacter sp.]MDZ4308125.1 alpha/beta hydrolase [Allopontixanthobacter sp.]MDZ4327460.1 alpha/beta hydrolase [Pseudomonas sp.]